MGGNRRKSRGPNEFDDAVDHEIGQGTTQEYRLVHAEEAVPKFDGRDKTQSAERWAQDVEENAEIFQWRPLQTLIFARRALSGTAALWLNSERPHKSWEEFKAALLKEFPDSLDSKAVHEMMSERKKRRDENCIDYMLIMKELGKRGKIPDYVAIKYIIDGIIDEEINKVMLYGVRTYSELKDKLKIYESVKEKMTTSTKNRRNTQPATSNFLRRCYGCGEMNHESNRCPNKEKGLKCFKCNEFGHISTQCKIRGDGDMTSGGSSEKEKVFPRTMSEKRRLVMFAATDSTNRSACMCGHDIDSGNVMGPSTSKSNEDSEVMQVVRTDLKIVRNEGKPLKTVIIAEKHHSSALIDSGSDVNLMSAELCAKLFCIEFNDGGLTLTGLGRSQVKSLGKIKTTVNIDGQCYNGVVFHIIPRDCMPYDIIIGHEFLKSVTLFMSEGCVTIFKDDSEWLNKVNCITDEKDALLEQISDPLVRREVFKCMETYHPVQVREAPLELRIVLKDDVPVAQRPRRLSYVEQGIVERQVNEWLSDGIIRVSFSEYSSPLVLVKKKDGTTRVCVDYRWLNAKIMKDEYPLPVIDDLIDRLSQAKVFSVLDLKNGFFHLKISEESIKYTSFVTHHGQFEFLRAPFGLSICPKYFMRFVNIIFRELIAQKVMMIFIDDIIIPADNEEQALRRLKQVLKVAEQFGLRMNWKKARLMQTEVEYLGHIIRNGEVRPTSEKTDAVVKFPEPKTSKQLKSFLGLTSYFRKYIEHYADIARPLSDLLKKNMDFVFDKEQQEAFHALKEKLCTGPVLKIYDHNLKTELHTDASSIAIAAVLMQYHPNTGLHPVQYMSRKTNDAQRKYSSYELEALAIIEGIKKFRHYLFGKHFKLVTDCKAFQQTVTKKDLSAKVARWVLMLNDYDFEVEHRAGGNMRHVDALSRNPYVFTITSLRDQIKQAQDQDDGVKAIKELLKKQSYKDYSIDGDILYKESGKLLVIPKHMEKEIIKRIHGNGHFSKRKMKELITQDYYIKDVDKKIEEFVISCIPCLLATRKEGKQEGFLNPIGKESIPLDTLHLDHVGPLTETRKQYNYILTVIDAFTKFVWMFPTKSTTSAETLNKLRIHQQTFGNPRRIITDRGTAFTSREFEEYCEEESIQHLTITTGIPRGNGQVERVHRIIIPLMTKLCIENASVWYKHVSRVQRALNSTFQRSIKTTPFNLLIGSKMRNKEDIEIMDLLQEETASLYDSNREDLRVKAKEQILAVQEENRKYFNRRRKESRKYKIGDLVAIKRTQFGTGLKLKAKYLGPYSITKIHMNDRYDMEKIDSSTEGPIRTSSSADQIKWWPIGNEG